jgi:hypothetical protein
MTRSTSLILLAAALVLAPAPGSALNNGGVARLPVMGYNSTFHLPHFLSSSLAHPPASVERVSLRHRRGSHPLHRAVAQETRPTRRGLRARQHRRLLRGEEQVEHGSNHRRQSSVQGRDARAYG